MFQKKLKIDDFESIIEALNDATIRDVAKTLNVSSRTLQRYLKAIGGYTPKYYNPNPKIDLNIDEIARLRSEKMSFRRIAKRYNVCAATVFNAIQRQAEDSSLARDLLHDLIMSQSTIDK